MSEFFEQDLKIAAANRYEKIAARLVGYDCLSEKELLGLLSLSKVELDELIRTSELLCFDFGDNIGKYPKVQFHLENRAVRPVVPAVLFYLSDLDSWSLLDWFTTIEPDLGFRPLEVLDDERYSHLLVRYAKFFCASLINDE